MTRVSHAGPTTPRPTLDTGSAPTSKPTPSQGGTVSGGNHAGGVQGAFDSALNAGGLLGGLIPGGLGAGSAPSPAATESQGAPGGALPMMQEMAQMMQQLLQAMAGGQGAAPGSPSDGGPAPTPKPSSTDKRPPGDSRSAQDVINGDPTLKNLGNQSGVKDMLKKQVGDFEHDPDAAYRASEVLKYIKTSQNKDGGDRSGDEISNGKIDGFTKDGDARHGTEAGLLQDFGKDGYSALPDNHQLPQTNDKHVKEDGTNMDNAAYAGHEILHGLSEATGWIGKELDHLPGPFKNLLAPLHMASKALSGGLGVADAAVTGGDAKQAAKDMAHGLLSTGSGIIKANGAMVEATAGKVPGIGKLIGVAASVGSTAEGDAMNVADTAIQGGNTKQAAEDMGYDVGQSAVTSAVGLVDPPGVAANAAGNEFRNAIDPSGA